MRLMIAILLVLILGFVTCAYLTRSTELTPQQALDICKQWKPSTTLPEAESLLGKPRAIVEEDGNKLILWQFVDQQINHIEAVNITMHLNKDGMVYIKDFGHWHTDGWNAWKHRWYMLKHQLGIK